MIRGFASGKPRTYDNYFLLFATVFENLGMIAVFIRAGVLPARLGFCHFHHAFNALFFALGTEIRSGQIPTYEVAFGVTGAAVKRLSLLALFLYDGFPALRTHRFLLNRRRGAGLRVRLGILQAG